MPVITLTTAGTRQPFVTGVSMASNPTARVVSRMHMKNIGPGTVYIGLQKPLGVQDTVSSAVYDIVLSPGETHTQGWGDDNFVDLGSTYWDASTDATKLSYGPETY